MVPKTPVPGNVVRKSSVLNRQISVNYNQTFERSKDVKIPPSCQVNIITNVYHFHCSLEKFETSGKNEHGTQGVRNLCVTK